MRLRFLAVIPFLSLSVSALAQAVPAKSATGENGMVVTAQHYATDVGVTVLKDGGNAIDAAVAVGYALAVVHPEAGNIGGGGFMVIHLADGTSRFIDFRERAQSAATPEMLQDKDGRVVPERSAVGYLAAAIPGTVLGFETVREKYGTLPRERLMAPAIDLAEKGFTLGTTGVANIREEEEFLAKDAEAARIFLVNGHAPKIGTVLRQPDLAKSLRAISRGGADAFYRGPIADAIVAASQRHGGIFQKVDFSTYKIHERDPIRCSYRGYEVITAAPPSSGGVTMCEIFNILSGYDLGALPFHSAQSIHLLAEAMRHGFFDRNSKLGDPDFVDNPVAHLMDKDYAATIRDGISPDRAASSASLGSVAAAPNEGRHTTDYTVMDKAGNSVSVVYTLNDWFGAKVVPEGTGIVLNNEIDDFTAKPNVANAVGLVQGAANDIRPGKSPLSSMSPTIVTKDGKTVLATGSFGSGTIITSVLQVIVNLVDYRMPVGQAVDAPRIHQQWMPDEIQYDAGAITPDVAVKLEAMGYKLSLGTIAGANETILVGGRRLGETGGPRFVGAADRRSPEGSASGW